jgi:hypothetical protein
VTVPLRPHALLINLVAAAATTGLTLLLALLCLVSCALIKLMKLLAAQYPKLIMGKKLMDILHLKASNLLRKFSATGSTCKYIMPNRATRDISWSYGFNVIQIGPHLRLAKS